MENATNNIRQLSKALFDACVNLQAGQRMMQDEIQKHYGQGVAEEPLVQDLIKKSLLLGPENVDSHPCWRRLGAHQEPLVVHCYRGEHGKPNDSFQTRHPTLSFSSLEVATAYAETPNMHYDEVISPRIYSCELQFMNPWVPDDDPYSSSVMPMSEFREILSETDYKAVLSSADVMSWLSYREDDFADFLSEYDLSPFEVDHETWAGLVEELGVEAFDELNIETFHIADMPVFIETLRLKGHDGFVVGSAGDYEGEFEYHPFYLHQITTLNIDYLKPALINIRVVRGVQSPEHAAAPAVASITFTDNVDVATHYATHPNDTLLKGMGAYEPSLVYADISISKPLVNTPGDAMIDLTELRFAMADDSEFSSMMMEMSDWVVSTDAWHEHSPVWRRELDSMDINDKELLDMMLAQRLEQLVEPLCVQLYPLLDSQQFIQKMKSLGYDGAIHRGSGVSMDAVEYRVFSSQQISNVQIRPASEQRKNSLRI